MRPPSRQTFLLTGLLGCLACGSEGPRSIADSNLGGASAGGARSSTGGASGQASNSAGALSGSVGGGGSPLTSDGGTAGSSSSNGGSSALPRAKPVIYVGGFGSEPVLAYDVEPESGAISPHGAPIDAGPEPSCFALDASHEHLYVCNESDDELGGLTAFAIDAQGSLTRQNHLANSDSGLTSLSVHPNGKWIAGAGYSGGSVSLFSLAADGSLLSELDSADFGDDAQAHCVAYDPSGAHVLVTTKGLDAVQQLLLSQEGKLTPNQPPSVPSDAGAGPRHLLVHPNGKLALVINERGSSITSYRLSSDGKLSAASSISSLPAGYQGQNTGAHLELSPDARFLYVSNRGHDSIGVYALDAESGGLTLLEHEPSRGSSPHDFDIDERGELLAAINRKSSTLVLFRIAADGSLSPLGEPLQTRSDPSAVLIHYPR